ncbi:hypothetical protein F5878DRAFT_133618 [Lentinula raphanica]|uniref:Uncharacterized protein n=1 Tax=Lentinula raphanica TaxID=153919 RepID=A0AA38PAC8_9AGAR|nr:hypothetical protein F5878DRAFT_133618 [Lentinula raphanica]
MTRSTASRVLAILFIGAAVSSGVIAAPTLTPLSSESSIGAQAQAMQSQPPASQGHRSALPPSENEVIAMLRQHDNVGASREVGDYCPRELNSGAHGAQTNGKNGGAEQRLKDMTKEIAKEREALKEAGTGTLKEQEKKYERIQMVANGLEKDLESSKDQNPGSIDVLCAWAEAYQLRYLASERRFTASRELEAEKYERHNGSE